MRVLKFFLLTFIAAGFILAGVTGCAHKQLNSNAGQVKAQKPSAEEKKGSTAETEGKEARSETEAPPGPKEQPEPTVAARAEKALHDVHFDYDKYDIKTSEGDILVGDASWIKDNTALIVTVEGNCDQRGTVEYNLALGERRAQAAKDYLISLGVKESLLKTISYGKSKPVDPAETDEAYARNRRDHFVVQ